MIAPGRTARAATFVLSTLLPSAALPYDWTQMTEIAMGWGLVAVLIAFIAAKSVAASLRQGHHSARRLKCLLPAAWTPRPPPER
jgi:hypothetical protein